jgi:hypothetical protein
MVVISKEYHMSPKEKGMGSMRYNSSFLFNKKKYILRGFSDDVKPSREFGHATGGE